MVNYKDNKVGVNYLSVCKIAPVSSPALQKNLEMLHYAPQSTADLNLQRASLITNHRLQITDRYQLMSRDKKDAIDYGEMPNNLGYHIHRAYSYFSRVFAHYGKRFGIKSQQTTILALTQRNPGISPATIADFTSMERSLMAKLTADLEERGLLERHQAEFDRRHKGLFITKAGDKFIECAVKLCPSVRRCKARIAKQS